MKIKNLCNNLNRVYILLSFTLKYFFKKLLNISNLYKDYVKHNLLPCEDRPLVFILHLSKAHGFTTYAKKQDAASDLKIY